MADEVVTDISVILWIHDSEAITVRVDPEGMRMPVDNDLELYRKVTLFDAFAFEPSQLEVSHPENIVKPTTIILAQALFGNVFQYVVHVIGNNSGQKQPGLLSLLSYINQDTIFNGLSARIARDNLIVFIHVRFGAPSCVEII